MYNNYLRVSVLIAYFYSVNYIAQFLIIIIIIIIIIISERPSANADVKNSQGVKKK